MISALWEESGFCLVFRPSEYDASMTEIPDFFWSNKTWFKVHITQNYNSKPQGEKQKSWYVKEVLPYIPGE